MSKEFEEHLVRFRNWPLPVRVVCSIPRTFIAIAVGIVALYLGLACSMMLRTATVHGIISFVFNTALLALMVNIAASAIWRPGQDRGISRWCRYRSQLQTSTLPPEPLRGEPP